MTEITHVQIADFCDDETTVSVTAKSGEEEITFYVQTTDCEYRGDLDCWVNTDNDTDISFCEDGPYKNFDSSKIIKAAENFIEDRIEHTRYQINGHDVYFIHKTNGSCDVVTENKGYVNHYSSAYQSRFSGLLEHCLTREDAICYAMENGERC